MIHSKALSVELVCDAKQVSTIVDVVAGSLKIWASLDRSFNHVDSEALLAQLDSLSIVSESICIIIILRWIDKTSKDHDFLSCYLGCPSMNDSKLVIVIHIVDSLPYVLLNIECFNLLDKVESEFVADARFWLQAFTSKNKDIFLIELANTEALSGLLEVWKHDPLLA